MATGKNRRTVPREQRLKRVRSRLRAVLGGVLRTIAAVLVVATTFGAVIGLYLWLTTTPKLAVREVAIVGNHHAPLARLAQLAGIRPGQNLAVIDPEVVANRLRRHPWVRVAAVRRELPDKLLVQIEEYEAVAIASHQGLYLVSKQGKLFKSFEAGDPPDLPLLSGLPVSLTPEALADQLRLGVALLARVREAQLPRPVGELHLDPVLGVSLTLKAMTKANTEAKGRRPALVAQLGDPPFEPRLARLKRLLRLLSERGEYPTEVFVEGHMRPQWVVARVE